MQDRTQPFVPLRLPFIRFRGDKPRETTEGECEVADELKKIVKELSQQGWAVAVTASGHYRATPPNIEHSAVVLSSNTDTRTVQNNLRDLRARGFVWPPLSKKEKNVKTPRDPDYQPPVTYLSNHTVTSSPPRVALVPPQQPQAPPPPDKASKKTEDQLFQELKEARSYDALAGEHLRECQLKVEAATKELASADREKKKAADELAKAKEAFDSAFEPA